MPPVSVPRQNVYFRGRQITVDAPDSLDATGATLANITTTIYFPDGTVQETSGGQAYRTTHTYDYADRQKTLTTYGTTTATTTWTYSPTRGFMTRKEYADTKGTDYAYTAAGRLRTRTWARGNRTRYDYESGRLAHTRYFLSSVDDEQTNPGNDTATPDVSITYDSLGRQFTQSNGIATSTFAYDPATLSLDTETLSYDLNADSTPDLVRVLDRSQDTLNRSTGFQLKDGTTVEAAASYGYDLAGRLNRVDPAYPLPTGPAFTYAFVTNSGSLVNTVTGPAHNGTNTWETTRDVLALKENKVGTTVISSYDYSVNATGQRTDVSQAGTAFAAARGITWGYDSLGQVTKADHNTDNTFDRAYQYDAIGNRIEAINGATTVTGTPNYASNSLNQYSGVGALNPTYDFDGNATAYPLPVAPSSNSTLVWDAENRKISDIVGTSTNTYLYDSQSRRIAKTVGGTTTLYLYDGWNSIAEYSGTTLSKTRLWGIDLSGGQQGAGGVGGLLMEKQGSNSYYPSFDGNGNVSEYLDSAGVVTAHFEYDPFGNTVVNTDTAGLFSYRFSTKPLDPETGLYYYGYRYYDPITGRWPSRDPIGEMGGANLYGFVTNNAISGVDHLGNMPVLGPNYIEPDDVPVFYFAIPDPGVVGATSLKFDVTVKIQEDKKCCIRGTLTEAEGPSIVIDDIKKALQQNLWVNFGSGRSPSV